MARQALSAPVSLILIIVGVVLMYSVLHAHGWNLYGGIPLSGVYRTLPMLSRALVVGGLVITALGQRRFDQWTGAAAVAAPGTFGLVLRQKMGSFELGPEAIF